MRSLVLLVAGMALSSSFADEKPLLRIVGHRGEPKGHPENTLPAFEACLRVGAGFELDVRRTRDGRLVVLHDATLDRTTDGRGNVADIAWDDLRKLDAGSRFDPRFAGKRVPELQEVFALLEKHRKPATLVCIDLKIADGKVEADVVRLARDRKVLDSLLFIGTSIEDARVRERIRAADPAAQVACLANRPENLAAAIDDKCSDWVYLRFVPDAAAMKRIRAAKKKAICVGPLFMGNEPENWKQAAAAGVDALLTDYPREARTLFMK